MPSDRFRYYLEQCREMHTTRKTFSGRGVLKYGDLLVSFAKRIGATSALDYGCGKGNQYMQDYDKGFRLEEKLGFTVAKYDPAVEAFSIKPDGLFDLVWCTDVMEHIPEEDIAWVIRDIDAYALKGIFITVATHAAKKSLPNGENAHITQKPAQWWRDQFAANLTSRPDGFEFSLRIE